jgi:pimeloyl-ACP methyl ester carboxylesterase
LVEAVREIVADNGPVRLSGSAWIPETARAGVLMFPGSGASNRDNDTFFPPIRRHLLEHRIAVASFDKRGVGGSGGDSREIGIEEQADDAIVEAAALRELDGVPAGRVGLFGHSQGGWVVLEAAARDPAIAFAIPSSGPGVTPGQQDRWALEHAMLSRGVPEDLRSAVLRLVDQALEMLRGGEGAAAFDAVLRAPGNQAARELLVEAGVAEPILQRWEQVRLMIDHDPVPAMRRLRCPVLALFGADDVLVPVPQSVEIYRRELGSRGLLTLEVFEGAGHRLATGEGELVEGYLERLSRWILEVTGTGSGQRSAA